MKRLLVWLMIFVLAFSIFAVCALAEKDSVYSPEEDTDIEDMDGPYSPRTGIGGNVLVIAVCFAALLCVALAALKKTAA